MTSRGQTVRCTAKSRYVTIGDPRGSVPEKFERNRRGRDVTLQPGQIDRWRRLSMKAGNWDTRQNNRYNWFPIDIFENAAYAEISSLLLLFILNIFGNKS